MLVANGFSPMHKSGCSIAAALPACKRWSRGRARAMCPRRHLRVLPIRTRPSLFGGCRRYVGQLRAPGGRGVGHGGVSCWCARERRTYGLEVPSRPLHRGKAALARAHRDGWDGAWPRVRTACAGQSVKKSKAPLPGRERFRAGRRLSSIVRQERGSDNPRSDGSI